MNRETLALNLRVAKVLGYREFRLSYREVQERLGNGSPPVPQTYWVYHDIDSDWEEYYGLPDWAGDLNLAWQLILRMEFVDIIFDKYSIPDGLVAIGESRYFDKFYADNTSAEALAAAICELFLRDAPES